MDLSTWMAKNKVIDNDLALKVGVTRPYITRIRNGAVHPNLGVALAIWEETDRTVDLYQLLPLHLRPTYEPEPEPEPVVEPVKPKRARKDTPEKRRQPKASRSHATA